MSYISEVIADSSGKWVSNACVYATKEEAETAGRELQSRWMAVTATRATESTSPVNYRFNFETYRSERIEASNV
jgi:hypothetical protein